MKTLEDGLYAGKISPTLMNLAQSRPHKWQRMDLEKAERKTKLSVSYAGTFLLFAILSFAFWSISSYPMLMFLSVICGIAFGVSLYISLTEVSKIQKNTYKAELKEFLEHCEELSSYITVPGEFSREELGLRVLRELECHCREIIKIEKRLKSPAFQEDGALYKEATADFAKARQDLPKMLEIFKYFRLISNATTAGDCFKRIKPESESEEKASRQKSWSETPAETPPTGRGTIIEG